MIWIIVSSGNKYETTWKHGYSSQIRLKISKYLSSSQEPLQCLLDFPSFDNLLKHAPISDYPDCGLDSTWTQLGLNLDSTRTQFRLNSDSTRTQLRLNSDST